LLSGKKGVEVGNITTIISHNQEVKQYCMYLKRIWKEIDFEEYTDTAKTKKDLSEEGS